MLEFFQTVVFERKVRKVVDPNAGYSGQIGIAAPGAGLRKGRKKASPNKGPGATESTEASVLVDNSMVQPTEPTEPTESTLLHFDASAEVIGNEDEGVGSDDEASNSNDASNNNEYSGDTCNNEAAGSEDEAEDLSAEEQRTTDATAESLISSITEKNKGMPFVRHSRLGYRCIADELTIFFFFFFFGAMSF